ncbi:hypothetical protein [Streptomyces griseoflavus]|uniref:hypothetical protein n=1 Tax=Streptomyces griseoflavus TaxID=35619 RepID=UPI0001B4B665|nr:hypothetical protein [Streptomyces griseoflavus]
MNYEVLELSQDAGAGCPLRVISAAPARIGGRAGDLTGGQVDAQGALVSGQVQYRQRAERGGRLRVGEHLIGQ